MSEGKMKRTSLFLDQALLRQVMRALGVKNLFRGGKPFPHGNAARQKVEALPSFFGKGLWKAVSRGCERIDCRRGDPFAERRLRSDLG